MEWLSVFHQPNVSRATRRAFTPTTRLGSPVVCQATPVRCTPQNSFRCTLARHFGVVLAEILLRELSGGAFEANALAFCGVALVFKR